MEESKPKKNVSKPKIGTCKVCGAGIPRGVNKCIICGTQRGSSIPLHSAPEKPATNIIKTTPAEFYRNKSIIARIASLMVVVLTASALIVGVSEYLGYQKLVSGYKASNAILYQQGSNMLKLKLPNYETPFELTDKFQSSSGTLTAKKSSNERYIAYLNNQRGINDSGGVSGNLFLLDLVKLSPESTGNKEGFKLESSLVKAFEFIPKEDKLVYVTNKDDLYICDFSPIFSLAGVGKPTYTLIDKNVKGIGAVETEGILYYKGTNAVANTYTSNQKNDSGSSFDLYRTEITGKEFEPVLIDSGVYAVHDYSRELNDIIYTKRTQVEPLVLYDLIYYSSGQILTISTDTAHVVKADASKGKALFLAPLQSMIRFEDMFNDDKIDEDTVLKRESFAVSTDEPDDEETDSDSEESKESLAENERMLLRERFRASIKFGVQNEKQNKYISFILNQYDAANGETARVAGPLYNFTKKEDLVIVVPESDYVVFVESKVEGLIRDKISELSTEDLEEYLEKPFELLSFLAEHLPDSLTCLNTDTGDMWVLHAETGEKYIGNIYIERGKQYIYFISHTSFESATGTLYQTPMNKGAADKTVYIDEDVGSIVGVAKEPISGIVYQTESRDEVPQKNIYVSTEVGIKEIALDTGLATKFEINNQIPSKLYFNRSYTESTSVGELYYYDTDEHFISDSVNSILYKDSKGVFYTKRADNGFMAIYYNNFTESLLLGERLGGFVVF